MTPKIQHLHASRSVFANFEVSLKPPDNWLLFVENGGAIFHNKKWSHHFSKSQRSHLAAFTPPHQTITIRYTYSLHAYMLFRKLVDNAQEPLPIWQFLHLLESFLLCSSKAKIPRSQLEIHRRLMTGYYKILNMLWGGWRNLESRARTARECWNLRKDGDIIFDVKNVATIFALISEISLLFFQDSQFFTGLTFNNSTHIYTRSVLVVNTWQVPANCSSIWHTTLTRQPSNEHVLLGRKTKFASR